MANPKIQEGIDSLHSRLRALRVLPLTLLLTLLASCSRTTTTGSIVDLTLTDRVDASGRPVRVLHSFAASADTIYAVAVVSGAAPGERVQARWYLGGELVQESPAIALPDSGARYVDFTLFRRGDAFPVGNFRVEVLLAGKSVRSADFTVG